MRKMQQFNQKWAFSKEADKVPERMPERWVWVDLPHTWNGIDGQDGGGDYFRGTCYYANTFKKADLPEGDEYYLEVKAANASADVYLNGKKLKHHDGGYSAFRVNMTEQLKEENLIVIAVDNGVNDFVYPQQADFTFYGGLYRGINIIAVPKTHFELEYYGTPGIKVTPRVEGGNALVETEVWLSGDWSGKTLEYILKEQDGTVIETKRTGAEQTAVRFEIRGAHLWNGKKDPYLYTMEVRLTDKGEELDCVRTRFGCRTFYIDPEKGFFLNGESYPLRGVSRHQDRPKIGNALLPEHHQEDIELICEMGATTVRLAHYQHDQYFYDLCDEKGLVVWAEIPYISGHMPNGYENTISQMKELIIQNYNHPCIVVWGLSNEITINGSSDSGIIENHKTLNDMAHKMDNTRLTTMACLSMCDIHDPYVQIPDVVSFNHYFGWYGGDTSMNGAWFDRFHAEFPNKPVGMSEYGCEALDWHSSEPESGDYTEEYQAHYHEELIKQLFTRPYIWATHVWNMFDFASDAREEGGDNGKNHKGLVTFDRKYKKDAFYAYKAWLSDEPFVHICGKRYVDRVEDVTKITVYSNQPEVELFVNGKRLEKKTAEDHFFYFQVPNRGESKLCAQAGNCRDESFIRKVETFNEKYRMKEKGAVLNWFDITAPAGCFSLNDKIRDIVKSEQGAALVKEVIGQTLLKMKSQSEDGKQTASAQANDGLMAMMGSFTLLRLLKLMGIAGSVMTKADLLDINKRLNRIKKPETLNKD